MYERITLKRLNEFLQENETIIPEQFGFVSGKNTTLQLARIINKDMINFNTNKVTNLTTIDLERAYDTVWHDALIYIMSKVHIPAYLIRTILHILQERTFKVTSEGVLSDKKSI